MPRQPLDLGDIKSLLARNPSLAAANPHLMDAPNGLNSSPGAPPAPVSGFSSIKGAKAPKKMTVPEVEMELILKAQMQRGEILQFGFEAITLLIGDPPCRYSPDMTIWLPDRSIRFLEVKGAFVRPDSLIKFKCARKQYPFADWQFWQRSKEREWRQLI